MAKLPEECITKYDVKWTENGIDLANEGNHSMNLQIYPVSETHIAEPFVQKVLGPD